MAAFTVRKLARGEIQVGNDTFQKNLILCTDKVIPGWTAGDVADIRPEALLEHLSDTTEIVLLGTGWRTVLPHRELVFGMARRGVGFESMQTPAACRTFNILAAEGRDVTAFLIIQ
jgi:uncharacterized protein